MYDIKQSDSEAPAVHLWEIWSTPSLPLLPGPLFTGAVVPDRVQSMTQTELVFIGNPFEMRLLNLRINFFLLQTLVLILVGFFVVFLNNYGRQ